MRFLPFAQFDDRKKGDSESIESRRKLERDLDELQPTLFQLVPKPTAPPSAPQQGFDFLEAIGKLAGCILGTPGCLATFIKE